MQNKVDVVIDGKIINLRSDESPDYLQKVALYVDQKISSLKSKNLSAVVDERLRTLLIALNIADDYYKVSDQLTKLHTTCAKFSMEIAELNTEVDVLKEQSRKLKQDLEEVTEEFENFINAIEGRVIEKSGEV